MPRHLRHFPVVLLLILPVAAILLNGTETAAARPLLQAEPTSGAPLSPVNAVDNPWSEPINLSSSAIADNPYLVVATQGHTVVLWQEAGVEGMVYVMSDGLKWSSPQVAEFPFATRAFYPDLSPDEAAPIFSPLLLPDETNEVIRALWIDENRTLWHSQVAVEAFGEFQAWTQRTELAETAIGVNATVDADGTLHVSYMRQTDTEEQPAGVYYLQPDDGSPAESTSILLYPTRYAMALVPNNAQTQLLLHETAAQSNLLIGWELRPLQKIFLARSTDGGDTWNTDVVDERALDDAPGATAPNNLVLGSDDSAVFRLWQAGHDDAPCTQYYDWSDDGGETWHDAQPLLQAFLSCPSHAQLLTYPGANPLLLTVIDGRLYLQAWDRQAGSTDDLVPTWSEPQPQESLISFTNPDTFQRVNLSCLKARRPRADTIIVVGCQQEESKDIWIRWGTVETEDDWFVSSSWHQPSPVFAQSQQLNGLQMLTTGDNRAHAFWSQATERSVLYAQWNGAEWTRLVSVASTPQEEEIGPPAVAAAPCDKGSSQNCVYNILLSWHSSNGNIYFSRADSDQALTPADWSTPQLLPLPSGARAGQPAITYARGTILTAYTVPINQQRGLFLTISEDMGATWSQPAMLLDGVTAEWQIVGGAQLAVDDNGVIHALVTDETVDVNGGLETRALHYLRSKNEGQTFESSSAELPFTAPQEIFSGAVPWYRIAALPGGQVHLFWQEDAGAASAIWHQLSRDSGHTWDLAQRIPVSPGAPTVAAASGAGDESAVHLLHATPDTLQHWIWEGERWSESEALAWRNSLNAPATQAGDWGAAAAALDLATDSSSSQLLSGLLVLYDPPRLVDGQSATTFTQRPVEPSDPSASPPAVRTTRVATTPLPTATSATALDGAQDTDTDTTTATTDAALVVPGTAIPQASASQAGASSADPIRQIMLAVIPAGLLILAAGLVKIGLIRRR